MASAPISSSPIARPAVDPGLSRDALLSLIDRIPCFALLAAEEGAIVFHNLPFATAAGWSEARRRRPPNLAAVLGPAVAAALLEPSSDGEWRATFGPAGQTTMAGWRAQSCPGLPDRLILITGRDVSRESSLEDYIVANQWFETAAALSGGLAHDFNNVLAAVLGLSEIISLRLPPDSPLQDLARKIGLSVDRAKSLVRRFSQFSRKGAGFIEAQPTAMVLDELGRLVAGFLPGNVTFDAQLAPETPWCTVNRQALEQIVLNCANHLRARLRAESGHVILASRPSADKSHAIVELTGSGQGLLNTALEDLFELDVRPTTSAYESGAGLFTARQLSLRSSAHLAARRDDPRTLTFVLELPSAL